ncbi:hypothetical protein [Nocardia africana]
MAALRDVGVGEPALVHTLEVLMGTRRAQWHTPLRPVRRLCRFLAEQLVVSFGNGHTYEYMQLDLHVKRALQMVLRHLRDVDSAVARSEVPQNSGILEGRESANSQVAGLERDLPG